MIKPLFFSLGAVLFSSLASWGQAATAIDPIPEVQVGKTPSTEEMQKAPQAAEVLLEATVFARALERIIQALPEDFSNREDAEAYLQQISGHIDAIDLLMKKHALLHKDNASFTQQEIQAHVDHQVAGTLARTDLLIDLLTTFSSSVTKSRPEAMDLKVLQFMEDLASTVSEMQAGLEEEVQGGDCQTKHRKRHQVVRQEGPVEYFNAATLEATLNRDLKESLLDFN